MKENHRSKTILSGTGAYIVGGRRRFRTPDELDDPCGPPGSFSIVSAIGDGVDNVRKVPREELRRGASQLKGVCFGRRSISFGSLSDHLRMLTRGGQRSWRRRKAVHLRDAARLHRFGVRRCLLAGLVPSSTPISPARSLSLRWRGAEFISTPTFISLVQSIESASEIGLPASIVENLRSTADKGRQVF
jgi:hypothetical protein